MDKCDCVWNSKPLTRKLTGIPVGDQGERERERKRKRERERERERERNIEKERALLFPFRPYMKGVTIEKKILGVLNGSLPGLCDLSSLSGPSVRSSCLSSLFICLSGLPCCFVCLIFLSFWCFCLSGLSGLSVCLVSAVLRQNLVSTS